MPGRLRALLASLADLLDRPPGGRAELRAQLERHLGRHRFVEIDRARGCLVVGIGRIVDRRCERGGVRDDEIDLLCEHDIAEAEQLLRDAYPWTRDIAPARMGVLIELVLDPGLCTLAGWPGFLDGVQAGLAGDPAGHLLASRAMLSSAWAERLGPGRPDELAVQLVRGEWR